jgi:phytoene dehydrogenase-like protein
VFVPAGEELTVAQLGDEWKQRHSHRARAALELDARLPRPAVSPVVGSPAVEPDAALTELSELSSQVATVAVLDEGGNVVAATGNGPLLAGVAAELLAAGAELHAGSPVTRVQVTLRDGGVTVVREGARTAIATTAPDASPGLVLYDLRTLLHRIGGGDAA